MSAGARRRAAIVAAGVLLSLLLSLLTGCNSKDAAAEKAAPRLVDTSFEAAARRTCQAAVDVFNTDTTLGNEPTRAQSADALDSIDRTFAELVARLRLLPVAAADRTAVNAWLADWDAYVAFGRLYADAVRIGREQPLIRTQSAAQGQLRRRLRAFAAVNHLQACRFP